MYKLFPNGVIYNQNTRASFLEVSGNRHYEEYLIWLSEDNTPDSIDELTPEQIAKDLEVNQAGSVAKTWFSSQQAAIDFVRLTPAQQATQISGMTVPQKDTVLKYLAIAVSMLIKRELLP